MRKNLGLRTTIFGHSFGSQAPPRHQIAGRLNDEVAGGDAIGATMMRSGSNLIMNAMLIIGIGALLSLGTILVRNAGTTDEDGQVTADIALADLRGTVP